MGLNTEGLFVGLTNRATAGPKADRRSRGLLVRDALERRSASEVASEMTRELAGKYNPFHLVYSDGREAFVTCLWDERVETKRLEPGIHVVCNRGEDDPADKAGGIRRVLEGLDLDRSFDRIFADLADLLGAHDHSPNPLANPCVHTPDYGTRSSAILASGGDVRGFWFAEGPPCVSKFESVTYLLDDVQ